MTKSKRGLKRLVALLLLAGTLFADIPATRGSSPYMPSPKRLLVISPHPDDESLTAAAMIERTRQSGGTVRIVVMTNGDGFRKAAAKTFHRMVPSHEDMYQLGLLRQQEEQQALLHFGLRKQDLVLLGYPDAGLHRLWNDHWDKKTPYLAVNGYDHVPYASAYHPHAPYSGEAVADDLRRVLAEFQPTDVLFPDPHDIHKDHWATSAFAQYALTGLAKPPREWTYLVHYPDYPQPRVLRSHAAQTPPAALSHVGVTWHALPLSRTAIEQKHEAILSHRSQIRMMKNLLESFVRTNDLIGSYTIPTLAKGTDAPTVFLSGKQLAHTVVVDPADDQNGLDRPWADIRKVAAAQAGQLLHLCVEFGGPVRRSYRYEVSMRMPEAPAGTPSRYDLKVVDGRLVFLRDGKHVKTPAQVSYHINNNRLEVAAPADWLGHVSCFLLSARISTKTKGMDATPWQRIRLSQQP